MSETKFTPGPWIAAGPSFGEPKMKYADSIVADREEDDEDGIDICAMPFDCYDEEQEANANLIAAAPDLYAALEVLLECWKVGFRDRDIDQAKAALAKARGEQ